MHPGYTIACLLNNDWNLVVVALPLCLLGSVFQNEILMSIYLQSNLSAPRKSLELYNDSILKLSQSKNTQMLIHGEGEQIIVLLLSHDYLHYQRIQAF